MAAHPLDERKNELLTAYTAFMDAIAKHLQAHTDLYKNKSAILAKVSGLITAVINFQKFVEQNQGMIYGSLKSAHDISKNLFTQQHGRLVEIQVLFAELDKAERAENELACARHTREIKTLVTDLGDMIGLIVKYCTAATKEVRPSRLRAA